MEGNFDSGQRPKETGLSKEMFFHLLKDPELQTKKVLEICAGSGKIAKTLREKNENYIATDISVDEGVIAMDAAMAISHYDDHEILLTVNPQPMNNWSKNVVKKQYLTRAILQETLRSKPGEIWIVFNDHLGDFQYALQKNFFDFLQELHWYQIEHIEADYCILFKFKYGDEFKDFDYPITDICDDEDSQDTSHKKN